MRIYDRKGMLVIPKARKRGTELYENLVLVNDCYCPNGHNLVCNRVNFNNLNGIYLKARNEEKEGFIGLSPVYGEKCRIAWDIDLIDGEILEFLCPTCDESLPVFSPCHCGARIVAFLLHPGTDYTDCIGVCNRVNCNNSVLRTAGELFSLAAIDISRKRGGLIQGFLNFK